LVAEAIGPRASWRCWASLRSISMAGSGGKPRREKSTHTRPGGAILPNSLTDNRNPPSPARAAHLESVGHPVAAAVAGPGEEVSMDEPQL
jgi:hypothetical protein